MDEMSNGWDEDHIAKVIAAIKAWHDKKPTIVGGAASALLAPVGWLVSRVIPTSAIEGAFTSADWLAKNVLTNAANTHFEDLAACDRAADQVQNAHIAAAAMEGGAAGMLGLAGIPVDIIVITALSLRLIRQVGVEYGYGKDTEGERHFCLTILQGVSANSMREKVAADAALAYVRAALANNTWKNLALEAAAKQFGTAGGIMAIKALAKQFGINITKRKALEAIPIIGAAAGAFANGWYIRELGIASQHAFQERWLMDRGRIFDNPPADDEASPSAA